MEIEFIKSPTGAFNLAYSRGDTAKMEAKEARAIIDAGYAVEIPKKKATASPKSDKK